MNHIFFTTTESMPIDNSILIDEIFLDVLPEVGDVIDIDRVLYEVIQRQYVCHEEAWMLVVDNQW